jgi:hypothetical protein
MRSLGLVGIQVGNIDNRYQYLALYHNLVTMDGLHDEKNWPKGIGLVGIEERRRLVRMIQQSCQAKLMLL